MRALILWSLFLAFLTACPRQACLEVDLDLCIPTTTEEPKGDDTPPAPPPEPAFEVRVTLPINDDGQPWVELLPGWNNQLSFEVTANMAGLELESLGFEVRHLDGPALDFGGLHIREEDGIVRGGLIWTVFPDRLEATFDDGDYPGLPLDEAIGFDFEAVVNHPDVAEDSFFEVCLRRVTVHEAVGWIPHTLNLEGDEWCSPTWWLNRFE